MTKPATVKPQAFFITDVRPAGEDHQVVTVKSAKSKDGKRVKTTYRKKPCKDCPWRKDATGKFPAEAFKHSAETSYDMAKHTFACHDSSVRKPALCAGFLLRGADHNLTVRLAKIVGKIKDDVTDDGHELYESYRDMAIANGVDADDERLKKCR